jgi:hypothetical protein
VSVSSLCPYGTRGELDQVFVARPCVLDLEVREADIAIGYAVKLPIEASCVELMRDKFYVVANPNSLVRRGVF